MSSARTYLRLGDRVYHDCHSEWGLGAVVEVMTSTIIGGTCLVRVLFDDGLQRTFNNDLDHDMCCYRMGIKRETAFDWDFDRPEGRRSRYVRAARRAVSRD